MAKAERSHRIDEEESYRLLVGVVIDDAKLFNSKLQEWEDYYRPAVLVQKVHMNVSYVANEGDFTAAQELARLLEAHGREDELEHWTARSRRAKSFLDQRQVRLSFASRDTEELHRFSASRIYLASTYLAPLLLEQGRTEELERLAAKDYEAKNVLRQHRIETLLKECRRGSSRSFLTTTSNSSPAS